MRFFASLAALFCSASLILAASVQSTSTSEVEKRADGRSVFAHVVVGILGQYSVQDWENEMTTAQSIGIDAFALNIAPPSVDSFTETQLDNAYQAAENKGFKVFISFDFAYFQTGDTSTVSSLVNNYSAKSSQFMYNGNAFVSSFIGGNGRDFDWQAVKNQSPRGLYIVPDNFAADAGKAGIDGIFAWESAWPTSNNEAIAGPLDGSIDQSYISNLQANGKSYMAGVSPWYFTHFNSKNTVYYSDNLWQSRWSMLLGLNSQFAEIITWNDYGESHYINSPNNAHTDDGSSAWAAGVDHSAWQLVAKPYIQAYKSGSSQPSTSGLGNTLVYTYRTFLKDGNCATPDNSGLGKPAGTEYMSDELFVTAILENAGTVTLTSGSNSQSFDAPAGINTYTVPLGVGKVSVGFNGQTQDSSSQDVSADCPNNVWDYNPRVGSAKF